MIRFAKRSTDSKNDGDIKGVRAEAGGEESSEEGEGLIGRAVKGVAGHEDGPGSRGSLRHSIKQFTGVAHPTGERVVAKKRQQALAIDGKRRCRRERFGG